MMNDLALEVRIPKHNNSLVTFSPVGRINVICGPNASGKSTVLNALIGEDKSPVASLAWIVEEVELLIRHDFAEAESPRTEAERFVRLFYSEPLEDTVPLADFRSKLDTKDNGPMGNIPFAPLKSLVGQSLQKIITNFRTPIQIDFSRIAPDSAQTNSSATPSANGIGIIEHIYRSQVEKFNDALRDQVAWLHEAFQYCTDGIDFDITVSETVIHLYFIFPNKVYSMARETGTGLRVALTLLSGALWLPQGMLIIEEPEQHLHPRLLARVFETLRSQTDRTLFVSTHSNVLLRPSVADVVYRCSFGEGTVKVTSETDKARLMSDLGYLTGDNLIADVLIFVEGGNDLSPIDYLLSLQRPVAGFSKKYFLWPIGGDNMRHVPISRLSESYKCFAILDNEDDPSAISARQEFCENCSRSSVPVRTLSRYSLDNYWSTAAYMKLFERFLDPAWEVPEDSKLIPPLPKRYKRESGKLARLTPVADVMGSDLGAIILELAELLA